MCLLEIVWKSAQICSSWISRLRIFSTPCHTYNSKELQCQWYDHHTHDRSFTPLDSFITPLEKFFTPLARSITALDRSFTPCDESLTHQALPVVARFKDKSFITGSQSSKFWQWRRQTLNSLRKIEFAKVYFQSDVQRTLSARIINCVDLLVCYHVPPADVLLHGAEHNIHACRRAVTQTYPDTSMLQHSFNRPVATKQGSIVCSVLRLVLRRMSSDGQLYVLQNSVIVYSNWQDRLTRHYQFYKGIWSNRCLILCKQLKFRRILDHSYVNLHSSVSCELIVSRTFLVVFSS